MTEMLIIQSTFFKCNTFEFMSILIQSSEIEHFSNNIIVKRIIKSQRSSLSSETDTLKMIAIFEKGLCLF